MEATLNEKKILKPKISARPGRIPWPQEQNYDLELQWVMSVVVCMTRTSLATKEC